MKTKSSSVTTLGRILALAAIYYLLGRLGLLLAIPPGYATVFWPASGVALAAVYFYGYPLAVGVFLGSAVLNVLNGPSLTAATVFNGCLIAAGSTVQAVAGSWLLHRFIGPQAKLEGLRKILAFVFLGGPLSCLIGATCGTIALLFNDLLSSEDAFFTWSTWYIGDVLGVIVFSPLLVLLFNKSTATRRKMIVGLPLVIGFTALIALFTEVKTWNQRLMHEEFSRDSQLIAQDLNYSFSAYLREMQSLASFYKASDLVEKEEFTEFLAGAFQHTPGILALEWLPRVRDAQRQEFVQQLRKNEGDPARDIFEFAPEKKIRISRRQEEYFPILYAEPKILTQAYMGLDLSSDAVRREAMEAARDKNLPVATNRLHLLQEKDPYTYGFLVFLPIYKKHMPVSNVAERRKALEGFILGAFRFNDIIDPFVKNWRHEGIEVSLVNLMREGEELLYNSARKYTEKSAFFDVQKHPLPLFGRSWEVHVGKLESYTLAHTDFSIWLMLGGGILFISFIGVFLLYLTGRNTEVEQIVKERTEDLRLAHDRAAKASSAKSDFLANMSHEIRTPMTGIIGMGQLLLKTKLGREQQHYATAIASSAENLLQIIDDILDISKIEAGKISIENIPFNLRVVCRDVLELLMPQAQHKGIYFRLTYSEACPASFMGDPLRIRQVLFNLCSNAIKFTDQGGVTVSVEAEDMTGEAAAVKISVSDTGIGIPPDKQEKIFGKFDQADTSTTRKYGGTGLGLPISRNLAQMMGGNIHLQSETGKGSTFSFTLDLPCIDDSEVEANMGDGGAGFVYAEATALLAEDIRINQEIIATMLKSHGFSVDVVSNGREAVRKAAEEKYDLIFMDCQMPEVDGYEATRLIRQTPEGTTPIIALTAHAVKGDRERCLAAGMNDYLSKPLRDSALEAMLAKWMPASKKIKVEKKPKPSRSKRKLKHLDESALKELERIADGRFTAMIQIYITSAEKLMTDLEAALARQDRIGISQTAHALKSASGQVGAAALRQMMAEIEKASSGSSLETLAAALAAAREESKAVNLELLSID